MSVGDKRTGRPFVNLVRIFLFALTACGAVALDAEAGVAPDAASQLKSTLTPVGAERAGNADGSIPPWTGGYQTAPAHYVEGNNRPDPFAGEKPLFSITAANVGDYRDKLPDGQKALFATFPDYRMDVFPSHRTAAAPAAVYADIFANATRARAAPEGIAYGVEGAVGGVPFPIPQNGFEIVWNHLLAFWGVARRDHVRTFAVSPGSAPEITNAYTETIDFPYYHPGATPNSFGRYYFKRKEISDGPPALAGRAYLLWQPIDGARDHAQAWQYQPREHRVRRSPLLSYDTPTPDGAGIQSFDDYYMFSGGLDRYDFRLLGKQEMYIPYNNNRLYGLPVALVAGPRHANPDSLRYELHRVWVVEGRVAAGKRHLAARRRFYVDEDTWFIVYADAWDADGHLWKFSHGTMYLVPELPSVVLGSQFIYDLQGGGYVFSLAFNDERQQFKLIDPPSDSEFSPETLAAEGAE